MKGPRLFVASIAVIVIVAYLVFANRYIITGTAAGAIYKTDRFTGQTWRMVNANMNDKQWQLILEDD